MKAIGNVLIAFERLLNWWNSFIMEYYKIKIDSCTIWN